MSDRDNKWIICIFIIIFIYFINPASSQTAVEWNDKGFAFAESGEYNKAIEAYDKAIAIDPNYKIAWENKGVAFLDLGEYKKASEAFDKSITIDPNDKEVWFIKGVALAQLGEYKKASEASDRAIAIDPNYKEAWFGKGVALAQLGEDNKAIEAYDRAIVIDPNYKEAWLGKGHIFYGLGDYDNATEAFVRSEIQENNDIITGIVILIIIGIIIVIRRKNISNNDNVENICVSSKKRYENWLIGIFIPAITIGVLGYSGILTISEDFAGILMLIFKVAFIYITIWYGSEIGMKKHWAYILGFSTLLPLMWLISIAYLLSRKSPLDEQLRLKQKDERAVIEHEDKSYGGKWFFGVIIILLVMALGWYGTQDSSSNVNSTVVTSSGENKNLIEMKNNTDIVPEIIVNQLSIDAPAKAMAGDTIKIKITAGSEVIDGATIAIGTDIGTADKNGILKYTLPRNLKGTYSINASKTSYEKATQNIVIEKYINYRLSIEAPSKANLFETIIIKVLYNGTVMSGASVTFDNWTVGTTDSNGEVTYRLETSGNHSITASKKSYISVSRDIEIRAP